MHTNARAGDPSELPSVEGQSRSVNCHRQRDRVEKSHPLATNFDFTSGGSIYGAWCHFRRVVQVREGTTRRSIT